MHGAELEQTDPILLPRAGTGDRVSWEAKWRYRTGAGEPWIQKKARLGSAWLERDETGEGWRKRKGRCREGWLDERAARLAAETAQREHARGFVEKAAQARAISEQAATVRGVADDWLHWLDHIRGAKPSTVRDYRTLLREPGVAFKRGTQKTRGLIMAAFGDRPAAEVTTAEVNRFLRSLDEAGFSARNVNKYRQVLQALFSYAGRDDSLGLLINPVTRTDKCREPPLAALDYYEVEELEALARVCASSAYRNTTAVSEDEAAARAAEDRQDADAFRILFYTGVRVGELVTLRWADVDLVGRSLLVRRTISAGVETEPTGRRSRYVPLADPALAAFARLGSRDGFVDGDDYVVCNRWGRRIDESALRRRYKLGCDAAGLRPVKLHGLRHAAGSIVARTADPVFVRDHLGHSKLSTTDRYVSAKHRPEDYERLNRAFAAVQFEDPAERAAGADT